MFIIKNFTLSRIKIILSLLKITTLKLGNKLIYIFAKSLIFPYKNTISRFFSGFLKVTPKSLFGGCIMHFFWKGHEMDLTLMSIEVNLIFVLLWQKVKDFSNTQLFSNHETSYTSSILRVNHLRDHLHKYLKVNKVDIKT